MRTPKKRALLLLLLVLIVAVLVLVLPASAFASELTVHYGYDADLASFFDFETGTATAPGAAPCAGYDVALFDHAGLFIWTYGSPTQFAGLSNQDDSVQRSYETVTWADIPALSFGWAWDGRTEFVVKTAANNYFKVKLMTTTSDSCTFAYEELVESVTPPAPPAPPALLDALRTFIVTSSIDTLDARMQTSLLAKVNGARAALTRTSENGPRVAVNELKALVNQVEAQSGKKIGQDAAEEVIDQANAIIAALDC